MLVCIGLFGICSLGSSYIVVGLDTNEALKDDFSFSRFTRFQVVILGPLVLYFVGFQNFLSLVSFVGGIFLGLEGLFIVAMWFSARLKGRPILVRGVPKLFVIISGIVFLVALVYEAIHRFVP